VSRRRRQRAGASRPAAHWQRDARTSAYHLRAEDGTLLALVWPLLEPRLGPLGWAWRVLAIAAGITPHPEGHVGSLTDARQQVANRLPGITITTT
jgi:hypothetical protein